MKKEIKSIIALCIIMLQCVFFIGCGKSEAVKNAESLIQAIGTISFMSAESIQTAQIAYDALDNDEKKKVENYQLLENAWKDYNANVEVYEDNVGFSSIIFRGPKVTIVTLSGKLYGTYTIKDNTITVNFDDGGFDAFEYDPETDTLSIFEGALIFSKTDK